MFIGMALLRSVTLLACQRLLEAGEGEWEGWGWTLPGLAWWSICWGQFIKGLSEVIELLCGNDPIYTVL